MGYVPEDRRAQGLVMDLSIARNTSLASLGRLRHGLLIRSADERRLAADWAARLRLKLARLSDPASALSGGNQQKLVLAKWLSRHPSVLIVDEPTRGIDVATKAEVHRLLSDLAGQGVAILMISSELPEILGMADRVLVMHEGRLTADLPREEATEDRKSTRLNSSHPSISYAVFCLKKKKKKNNTQSLIKNKTDKIKIIR